MVLAVALGFIGNGLPFPLGYAAYAQGPTASVPGSDAFEKACGADSRMVFRFDSASLYIAPRWLDFRSAIALSNRYGSTCPNEPIELMPLYLNPSILDAAGTPKGLGRPFFFFEIGPWRSTAADARPLNSLPKPKASHPHIEEVTRIVLGACAAPSSRVYRLIYQSDDAGTQAIVEFSWGGLPGQPDGRTCFTPRAYRHAGLAVNYQFRQDRFPPADTAQLDDNDATREPGAVLAFDAAIRAWIDRLLVKR